MTSIKIVDATSQPKCPFCDKEIEVLEKVEDGALMRHMVYMCPNCKKIVGVGPTTNT